MLALAALALFIQDADQNASASQDAPADEAGQTTAADTPETDAPPPTDADSLIASFDDRYAQWGDLVAEMAARRARDRYLRDLLIPIISREDLDGDVRSQIITETADTFEQVDSGNTQWALSVLDTHDFAALNADMPELALGIVALIQHGDLDAQQRLLGVIEPLALEGEFDGQRYALLYDRVAEAEERPQRYGTQDMCVDGERTIYTLEDTREAANEARAELGLDSLDVYWERMFELYGPEC